MNQTSIIVAAPSTLIAQKDTSLSGVTDSNFPKISPEDLKPGVEQETARTGINKMSEPPKGPQFQKTTDTYRRSDESRSDEIQNDWWNDRPSDYNSFRMSKDRQSDITQ